MVPCFGQLHKGVLAHLCYVADVWVAHECSREIIHREHDVEVHA
jgi:hypothetical protein